ncbi:hypothetical protein P3T76_007851 [Phytophthora citrophthora]|uniref:Uncharacterized protein n=1 Tax=Phytophthora citrophthora TaxID=4793 RepID=A0AAD9GMH4_9STRA|nr:hypothetical protein P3T76_007851 [Phytophthora citrophthora]
MEQKHSIATANGFLSKRLLRTVDTLEESEDSEDEERMNVPGLDTVTSAISSTITKGKVKRKAKTRTTL